MANRKATQKINVLGFSIFVRKIMTIDKNQIMQLDNEEKRKLAFELLDSIDEEFIKEPLPDWKRKLIEERLAAHKNQPDAVAPRGEVRKKYFGE